MGGASGAFSFQAEDQDKRFQRLQTTLDFCCTLVTLARIRYSNGKTEAAERLVTEAVTGYRTVVRVLSDPQHDLSDNQRQTLETRLHDLREALDRAKAQSHP